jgi:hypothetical protein
MGLSKDGRIGFAIATVVGIALVLIKSEEAPWRIGLLSFFGICAIYVAKELDWVNLRNVELSILHPASQSESLSPIRLAVAILAAVSVTVMFGIITWPPHERAASVVLVSTSAPTPSRNASSHRNFQYVRDLQGRYTPLNSHRHLQQYDNL